MKLFNSCILTIMAIIFMTMNNIYIYLGRYLEPYIGVPTWFGYLGKVAMPIFLYLVVEGFFNTRNRVKYMKNFLLMGIVMIGFDMIFGVNNNIFLSLGLEVALMSCIEYIKTQEKTSRGFRGGIVTLIIICILSYFTEASIMGIGMTFIFYFLREKKVLMLIAYVLLTGYSAIFSMISNIHKPLFFWSTEWIIVFAVIPILLYNVKKKNNHKFMNAFFYWFYPIHLAIIGIAVKIFSNFCI